MLLEHYQSQYLKQLKSQKREKLKSSEQRAFVFFFFYFCSLFFVSFLLYNKDTWFQTLANSAVDGGDEKSEVVALVRIAWVHKQISIGGAS